jgi:molybdopterin synthase catalytic subunit
MYITTQPIDSVKIKTDVKEICVSHRVGWLRVGEVAVAIWVSAVHRNEAFRACRSVIDSIKKDVPIWQKEIYEDNTSAWVSCREEARVLP